MDIRPQFQYTPRAGRGDILPGSICLRWHGFQYTPRAGRGDCYFGHVGDRYGSFNTRPVRDGATLRYRSVQSLASFNTRPVRDGATLDTIMFVWGVIVSIHAPCGTGRHLIVFTKTGCGKFQYTPRAGRGDLRKNHPHDNSSWFQYTPRAGRGDCRTARRTSGSECFNTRPVRDGATIAVPRLARGLASFNTRPVRDGATFYDSRKLKLDIVSIHAPCGTGRPRSPAAALPSTLFQYTPRVGRGDRFNFSEPPVFLSFNTRPVWDGATLTV